MNNDSCYRDIKKNYSYGLCSFYDFDHPFMCQVPETQLKLNRDRGTPLVCDSPPKVVGVLSIIIPNKPTNSISLCTRTLRTHASYTKVAYFEKWIHSVIAVNTPTYSANGKPVPLVPLAPPFQGVQTGSIGNKVIWNDKSIASFINPFPILLVAVSNLILLI